VLSTGVGRCGLGFLYIRHGQVLFAPPYCGSAPHLVKSGAPCYFFNSVSIELSKITADLKYAKKNEACLGFWRKKSIKLIGAFILWKMMIPDLLFLFTSLALR